VVTADVVARHVLAANETLHELSRPECADAARLRMDPMLRAAVERWLQVVIGGCIDLAYHRGASQGWTPVGSARAAFAAMAAHGDIDDALAQRLGSASGMRNVLVHRYVDVDLERIASAVAQGLDDLRELLAIASGWIGEPGSA
jgi:uncharacterized protein YutE (UPF0331/DUF86 family)